MPYARARHPDDAVSQRLDREHDAAIVLEQLGRHRLAFLPNEVRGEVGCCLDCGLPMTVDEWRADGPCWATAPAR